MPERTASRFVASYYLYQVTATCVFFTPMFYVYYQERVGLALATILWLQAYYLVVRAALDLPLGALADRYSRRACLVAYAVGTALGAAILVVSPRPLTAVAAETLFAVGAAFKSGADSAFLFDGLARAGRLDLYPRTESRAQAVVSLASGAAAIVGGLLAALDLRLPYVATVLAASASAAIIGALVEDGPAAATRPTARELVGEAARLARDAPAVRWVMALSAFAIVSSHAYYYLQQPYLRAIGVPLALFGVVFAATKAVTALVASVAHRVDEAVGPLPTTALMAAMPLVGLAAMSAVAGPVGAALLLTRGVLDGLWQPLLNVYMNRLVPSRLRATMLSAQGLVARLALAAALALLGAGSARFGLARTLGVAAAVSGVAGAALLASGPRAAAPLAGPAACDSREG
jgi:MFS family permease